MTYPRRLFAAGAAIALHMAVAVSLAASAAGAEASESPVGSAAPGADPAPLFSWGGYFQAVGFMCLLLALLWLAVWTVRRSGKFRFLPMPGPCRGMRCAWKRNCPWERKRILSWYVF